MNINGYTIPIELIYTLGVVFAVLIICSVSFKIYDTRKKSSLSKELVVRTNSWWYITIGVAILILGPMISGTIIIAYISFVALREMFSIGVFRESDRAALFVSYFVIPVQFYLAYKMYYEQFLYFIPLFMFIGLPFILVTTGKIHKIGRSMSVIPAILILTIYMLSHMILLFHVKAPGYNIGAGGLIIFLILVTSFNDVFQFTWGKLLGKKKILPHISPNKTWEGFIGGILSTAVLAYAIRFLTPLNGKEAFITGILLAIFGFVGGALMSAIKRDLGIKDSGNLIPGHGGAMDRLDSIVITTPVFYHLLIYFIEH